MKLKEGFITQNINDTQFMVSAAEDGFRGLLRNNETAAFIVDCLKEETTEQKIIDALWKEYDAPAEQIAEDVRNILNVLRDIEALDET